METTPIAPVRTRLWRSADALIRQRRNQGVDEFVAQRRAAGMGWSAVAREIYAATDHALEIEASTLFRWYSESEQTPEKEAV